MFQEPKTLSHGVTLGDKLRAPKNAARENLMIRIEEFDETAPDYAFLDNVYVHTCAS